MNGLAANKFQTSIFQDQTPDEAEQTRDLAKLSRCKMLETEARLGLCPAELSTRSTRPTTVGNLPPQAPMAAYGASSIGNETSLCLSIETSFAAPIGGVCMRHAGERAESQAVWLSGVGSEL